MKKRCDNCENEATVFYRVSVNGHTEEMHLCADCAEREGVPMGFEPFSAPFSEEFFPLGSLFFPEIRTLARERTLAPEAPAVKTAAPTEQAPLSPAPAPSLATLKAQLKRAVRREDYLKAAALRDQIRALEGGK